MAKRISLLSLLLIGFIASIAQSYIPSTIYQTQYVSPANLNPTLSGSNPDAIPGILENNEAGTRAQTPYRVTGIVMCNPRRSVQRSSAYQVYIQSSNNPWEGTMVHCAAADTANPNIDFWNNFIVGNQVEIIGHVGLFQGDNQIFLNNTLSSPPIVNLLGTAPVPAPIVLAIDTFMNKVGTSQVINRAGEKYEGMYVQFNNVLVASVTGPTSGRYNITFQDPVTGAQIKFADRSGRFRQGTVAANGMALNPSFNPTSLAGQVISHVRGFITEVTESGAQTYRIAPWEDSDLGTPVGAFPVITNVKRNPIVSNSTSNTTITATITTSIGTITGATLYYAAGAGAGTYSSVAMTDIGGNKWQGVIPASTNLAAKGIDSIVKYYISATNSSSNTSVFPSTAPTQSAAYKVLDGGITKIRDIQYTPFPNKSSLFWGDTIPAPSINIQNCIVTGTETASNIGFVFLQQGTSPWSGIRLWKDASNPLSHLNLGDKVTINQNAYIVESGGMTVMRVFNTINPITTGNPLPPFYNMNSKIDSLVGPSTPKLWAEQYESMLVELTSQHLIDMDADASGINSTNTNFGEIAIYSNSSATTGVRAKPRENTSAAQTYVNSTFSLGGNFPYFRGLLFESFSAYKIIARDDNDMSFVLSLKDETAQETTLGQNYPNPAYYTTQIDFSLAQPAQTQLIVYDLTGKTIATLVNQNLGTGKYTVTFDAHLLPSGTYIYQLRAGNNIITKQMTITH
ncbi:MAG: T9SS type A sorting domain-containing protein [Bacteroidia bacterium]|nr:T9SS type A sorting domain-containing protein [Bacteroidia bacterium]